jgi:hypothetical protein
LAAFGIAKATLTAGSGSMFTIDTNDFWISCSSSGDDWVAFGDFAGAGVGLDAVPPPSLRVISRRKFPYRPIDP